MAKDAELEAQLQKQLGMHVLGPLIESYENELAVLRRELTQLKGRMRR